MYGAKEGGGEGGLLSGSRLKSWDDPECLLQEEEHIVSDGVDPVISQKKSAKNGPSL